MPCWKFCSILELTEGKCMAKDADAYSKRTAKDYNIFRAIFQNIVCKGLYMLRFKLVYRLEIEGKENIPKGNDYIIAPNHLSTLDPPLIVGVMPRNVAFMAKKELFDIWSLRLFLNWLGAFAVNREKLGPSTIKTVKSIKDSRWVFGIFPQGTREEPGTISGVTKGFANIAKLTKCGILPVGITGTDEVKRLPFSGKIKVKIGKVIPYSDDIDGMVTQWGKQLVELTGYKFVPNEKEEITGVRNGEASEKL